METILNDEMQEPCVIKNGKVLGFRKMYLAPFAKTFVFNG
jgi:hypothetical protein